MGSVATATLHEYLQDLLRPDLFSDYGPNGWQIEGRRDIKRIALSVSATRASAQFAVDHDCQALLVHHGLFWNFHGVRTLTGPFAQRIFPLVRHEINLFAYHLPLDSHLVVGNASGIARRIGLDALEPFGDYKGRPTGIAGVFSHPLTMADLVSRLTATLNHSITVSAPITPRNISRVGIITGGASGSWNEAVRAKLDAFITGEMREHDWHDAQEAGMIMLAGGHHATEQFGVKDLGAKITEDLGVPCLYCDSDNPA